MGGNTSSARHPHDDTVDFGSLLPQGVYTGPQDWNQQVVAQLIADRKLAPFYRPLEDYDESWDDDRILASRKERVDPNAPDQSENTNSGAVPEAPGHLPPPPPSQSTRTSSKQARPTSSREPLRITEASVYRGAVECPICFLYYPPNINHSRCCDHPICTECFVQIKRAEPTTTHIVSEPACCPYCVQDNFGVLYTPPPWRAGIGSEGHPPPTRPEPSEGASRMKSRRKSFGADSPDVVTIDQIRPDWEAKLAAVRAAVARRANRRIIMRQVGDRLIPVGISSGRIHSIGQEVPPPGSHDSSPGGQSDENGRGSRRRRGGPGGDINQYLGSMGLAGQDLEELMVMEAMRLSLMEHEEAQRKQAQEKKTADSKAAAAANTNTNTQNAGSSNAASSANSAATPSLLLPRVALGSSPGGRSQGLSSRVESREAELNRSKVPQSTPSMTESSISQSTSSTLESGSTGSRTPPTTTRTTATSIPEVTGREDPEGEPESCVTEPENAGDAGTGESSGSNAEPGAKDLKHGKSVSSPPSPASITATASSYVPLSSTPALEDEEPLLGERGEMAQEPVD